MTGADGYVHPALTTATPAARSLYHRRGEILEKWLKQVKAEVRTASELQTPIIVDTIPLLLERLAACLCAEVQSDNVTESSNYAQEHGGERARVTRYGPEQVIQEYILLREIIRKDLHEHGGLTVIDESIIQKSFDKSIQEGMIAYFLVHGQIREQFVATLTHDLRNPIGAIKMAGELIQDSVREEPENADLKEIGELATRILRMSKRADRLIQDMLDASVLQVGERLSLNVTEANIRTIVMEAIGERPAKETARLNLELIDYTGYWDAEAFQRSVENLVTNAFKYGDPSRSVTVKIAEANGRIMVSVHNFGNPIPAENVESLFQVFRRAEASRRGAIKGWGIGLALARSTAERLGGSLGVASSAELGTTFTMDVPNDARQFQDNPPPIV